MIFTFNKVAMIQFQTLLYSILAVVITQFIDGLANELRLHKGQDETELIK